MECRICSKAPVYRKKLRLCRSCYEKKRRRERAIFCPVSGCTRKKYKGGKCPQCRGYENTGGGRAKRECISCGVVKPIAARHLCYACYDREEKGNRGTYRHRRRRVACEAARKYIEDSAGAFGHLLSNARKKQDKTAE